MSTYSDQQNSGHGRQINGNIHNTHNNYYGERRWGEEAKAEQAAGNEKLWNAAREGQVLRVKHLLGQGADPDYARPNQLFPHFTVLGQAAALGHVTVVEALIAGGADMSRAEKDESSTALHTAIAHRQAQVVDVLLAAGAMVNARDKDGRTPLLLVLDQDLDIAEALLLAGADPNLCDDNHTTALAHSEGLVMQITRGGMAGLLGSYGAQLFCEH